MRPRQPQDETTEQALEHLRRLQIVTDTALAHLAVDDLLTELLIRVTEVLGTDTAAILLLDETTNELVARAAKGIEEEVEQGVRIPLGKGFAGRIAAERQPVFLREVDHSNVMNPILREKGIRSLLGVPLIVQSRLLGVLHIGTLTPREFDDADIALLELVADRVALAIHVGLYERERLVAETLQRTLLPESLPVVVGADFAAQYVPASSTGVGGDWYDVFVLKNGKVVVAVGDVVGRGLPAASVMGRLRNSLRAYAIAGQDPTSVVTSLNAMLQYFDRGEMATLIYSIVDVGARELTVVNAGHLPPIIAVPGTEARFIDTPPVPPLGARRSLEIEEHRVELPQGSTVLFYTDGLVEQRRSALAERLEELRELMDTPGPLDALPAKILSRLVSPETGDDIALLAVRLVKMLAEFRIAIPAHPDELSKLRNMIRTWLNETGVPTPIAYDVVVASGEACANAIEHAYGAERGDVEITMYRAEAGLSVIVKDRGQWRGPRGSGRGRGLPIMNKLASSVDVLTTDEGTEVHLGWRFPDVVAS